MGLATLATMMSLPTNMFASYNNAPYGIFSTTQKIIEDESVLMLEDVHYIALFS